MSKKKKSEEGPEETTAPKAVETPPETEATEIEDPAAVLAEELAAAQVTAAKNWDLYLRARAELDNFRKRAQRDKEDLARFANESSCAKCCRSSTTWNGRWSMPDRAATEGLLEGVTMTVAQFRKVMENFGVDDGFGHRRTVRSHPHQAMVTSKPPNVPANAVVQELQKGYLLNDRLLRPALVVVAKAPAESSI